MTKPAVDTRRAQDLAQELASIEDRGARFDQLGRIVAFAGFTPQGRQLNVNDIGLFGKKR
ncbi:MAG: hypothetical protein KIS78_06345 [Labilithrix sp.]|nr:hypothetical protein [Labilithrix sp.]